MAKKKIVKEEEDGQEISPLNSIISSPFYTTGADIVKHKQDIISISPCLDVITGGIPLGSCVLLTGDPKSGKGQPLDSIVWTPYGPKKMGNIKIGDIISSPNGTTSKVIGVFPQSKQNVYKVIFSDGDECLCDENHLWKIKKNNRCKSTNKLVQLKDFKNDVKFADRPKWKVELPTFCHFNSQNISLDPYLLGLILGDGGISQKSIYITNINEEILNYIRFTLFSEYELKRSGSSISYRIIRKDNIGKHNRLEHYYINALDNLKLRGHTSHTKFIPNLYKYNSYDIRLAVLQGLMDTDGCVNKRGMSCSITTVSRQLSLDIKELAQSLGFLCKISHRYTTCNNKKFPSYRLFIRGNDITKLFRITKKKDRAKKRTKPILHRTIKDIQYIGKQETQCIKIDSYHGMYLTDQFICTHNTNLALNIARNAQQIGCPIFYLNVEARIKPRDLEGIHGLNIDNFNVIGSYYKSKKTEILSAEKYLGEAEKIIHTIPRSIIIVDSVSHLITQKELAKDLGEKDYAPGPVLMSQFLKRIYNVLAVNDVVLISILHYTTNMDPNSRKKKHKSGGRKIAHAADVDLEAKYFKINKDHENTPISQNVVWQTLSTAFLPPGQEVTSILRYGYGVDDIGEWMQLGQDLALVDVKGAWYSLAFEEDGKQAQGQEKFRQLLVDNPDMLQALQVKVKEMLYPQ